MSPVSFHVFFTLAIGCFHNGLSLRFGAGGFGGFGGDGGFNFRLPPPGPAMLPPVSDSTRWGDILEDTVQNALDHCKSVRMCNTTGWSTYYDSECSECHPCTCDDTCYQRGDCCADKLIRDVSEQPVLHTSPLQAPVMGCHSTYFKQYDFATYVFMMDRCPAGFLDADIVRRCMDISSNDTNSAWPVWSPATNTVYRNMDCARCHNENVDEIVRWNLKMECDQSVQLPDTSSEEKIIQKALEEPLCQLSFAPADGCVPFACRPSLGEYIDTCNVTGRRFTYDEALWKACEVFQGKVTLDDTYKNVFCAMCNDEEVEAYGECEDEWVFPYVLLLNVTEFQAVAGEPSQDPCRCRDDEVYDKYERKCRRLHCSMTRTLSDKECSPFISNSTGLFYDIAIQLTPDDLHKPVYITDMSSLKQVARNIRTSFLLQGSAASGWDVLIDYFRVVAQATKVNASRSGSDSDNQGTLSADCFKVHIKFASVWPEPAENLESRLLALMRSLWNVSVDGKPKRSFRATPLYIKPEENNGTETFPTVSLYSSGDDVVEYAVDIPDQRIQGYDSPRLSTNFYLPVSEALKCVKVAFKVSNETKPEDMLLRINETSGTVHHILSNKFISFEFVELKEKGVVLVCADQLFDTLDTSMADSPDNGNPFSAQLSVVSISLQTLSLVCLFLVVLTYCFFPELRTPTGKNTLGLVVTLLMTMLLFACGMWRMRLSMAACIALGVIIHFFLLSTFTWTAVCIFHSYRVLRRAMLSRADEHESNTNAFPKYIAVSLVCPSVIVAVTLIGNLAANNDKCVVNFGYGKGGLCFLSNHWSVILAAILPIAINLLLTLILYVSATRAVAGVKRERKTFSGRYYQQFRNYIRLSILMEVTWLTGLLAALLEVEGLWYAFVVLCCLLGVYVCLAFICNRRVLKLYRTKLSSCCSKQRNYKNDQKFTPIQT